MIRHELENAGFYEAEAVARCILKRHPDSGCLTESEFFAAKLIAELLELDENLEINPEEIATAVLSGEDKLLKIVFCLRDFGFTPDEMRELFQNDNSMLNVSVDSIKEITAYLKGLGICRATVRDVLYDALKIGFDEVKSRCETVLEYFSFKTLKKLSNGYLFCSKHTSPKECIRYAVSRCGVNKAEKLLTQNEMLLFWYKDEEERQNPFQTQHAHALELIEKGNVKKVRIAKTRE